MLDFANQRGYVPVEMVVETAGRSVPWQDRKIGALLMTEAQAGDVILTSEFTRLGGSPAQVFSLLEVAVKRGVAIIITKTGHALEGSMNSQIYATAFSLASMIEVAFLRARTREGLARARSEGRVGGRRKGSVGKLKLDPRLDEIRELHELGVKIPTLAKRFEVNVKTMRWFVRRRLETTAARTAPRARPRAG